MAREAVSRFLQKVVKGLGRPKSQELVKPVSDRVIKLSFPPSKICGIR
jgi:hypothetical protein